MTTFARRSFAALFGLWFTVLTVEPARVHPCPMHDGVVGASVVQAPMAGHAGHEGMASHASSSQAASSDPSAPEQHQAHQCTCPDRCCCSVTPAQLPAVAASAPVAIVAAVVIVPVERVEIIARAEYVLPFATAPPAIRLA